MKKKLFALVLALAAALSLTACGGGAPAGDASAAPEGKEADLAEFYESLLEAGEWPAMMALEDETLDAFYPGRADLSLKQCLVNTAAMSAAVGEIALVEVEDSGDVQTVEEIFQARIDYQVGDEENPGGAWYPMTIEGWQTNSHIVSNGNYVMLAVGEQAEDAVQRFHELFA